MPNVKLSKSIHPHYGACLHATVGRSRSSQRPALIRGPGAARDVHLVLLIDSGATITCLDENLLAGLRLLKRGDVPIYTVGSNKPEWKPTFDISLKLRDDSGNQHDLGALEVCCSDFSTRHHQGILGRDALGKCRFLYDGPISRFSLEF